MKFRFAFAAAAALLTFVAGAAFAQQPIVIKFSHVVALDTPKGKAAEYFKKLECFCFTKQSFAPHEKRRMPVVFVVDPKLPKEVTTITLSYTFFEVEGNQSVGPG